MKHNRDIEEKLLQADVFKGGGLVVMPLNEARDNIGFLPGDRHLLSLFSQ